MSARNVVPLLTAATSGLLFGIGLITSGMVDPNKVRAFLDVSGAWDPSLALVMAGAILVAMPVFQWAKWHVSPAEQEVRQVDKALVFGSLLFGIGWGLSGYCPGPALVAASAGSWEALWYVVAMAVGIVFGEQFSDVQRHQDAPVVQFNADSEIT